MLFERNGRSPDLHPSTVVAPSALLVGDVRIGRRCYIDHDVVLEGSDAPLVLGDEVAVLAGTVIRSVGSGSRPAFPVTIGNHTLIGPSSVLTGCRIGGNCYLASSVTVLPGADVGDDALLGIGAIVHDHVRLAQGTRIGRMGRPPSRVVPDILYRADRTLGFPQGPFPRGELDEVHDARRDGVPGDAGRHGAGAG